jgi:hypothetical protein
MKSVLAVLVFLLAIVSGPAVLAQAPAGPGTALETSAGASDSDAAAPAVAAPADASPAPQGAPGAFSQALVISGKSLAVIFFVMALFGGLITLLGRVYPGTEGAST